MTQAAIRTRLKTIIDSVSDIGTTHDYERFDSDWSRYMDLFKTTIDGTAQIRGAQIAYRGFTQELDSTCDVFRFHSFLIVTFLGVDDSAETEKTAAALVETIVNAIDSDATLNGSTYLGLQPCQVETFEPRVFGDVLCHYGEIRKIVPEEFNWSV